MNWLRDFWIFLGKYQRPSVRLLHLLVVLAIVGQLLSSNGMHFDRATGAVSAAPLAWFSSWLHIDLGLVLVPLGLVFVAVALAVHGPRHYFPYLWGDLTQARADLAATLQLRLAEPRPGGLAAIVTGLGFVALLLAVGSGAVWFFLWRAASSWAPAAREVHEATAGLIELYFAGHGLMASLHFLAWMRAGRGTAT